MSSGLIILQAIITVLLIGAILLQAGESGMFAGGGLMRGGENFHTRRGLEKFLFYATFVLLFAFVAMSLVITRVL